MDRSSTISWTVTVCALYIRLSQAKTLGILVAAMIPQNVKVLLLADRGFGRTVMAQFCRGQNFSYLIRIQPNVKVNLKSFEGKLLDYPVKKGIARLQQPNRLSK